MPENKFKRKYRILFTIPNFDTAGSGKALLNICRRLDKKFFEPYISCSHNKGHLFKEVIKLGIPFVINENQVSMIPRVYGLIKCFQLSKFFKNLKVDLIHSFHYGPDYSEALAAKFAGVPWVYTKKNMNWGGNSKNGWILRSMLSSHIFLQNKDMQELFFKKKDNTSLVPRGVDTTEFQPKKKHDSLISQYNIRNNELIILTVANISPVKGIDILIKSFKILSAKYNFLRLFIVGDKSTKYAMKIEQKAKNSSLGPKIQFTGRLYEVRDYYSIADIFVLPTIKKGEGCPVSLLEAMSCGIPPIASEVSGIKDILEPFPELLFSPGDKYNLAEKLENLIRLNDSKRDIYRKHILKKYNVDLEVSNHERVYKKMLLIN
tara:strand:+ start:1644 stop:2771 length:1128 start_codon:yes stop_codon:yes gene_type:complete